MTGENFKRISRHDPHLEKMIADLDALRDKWGEEYHRQDEDGYFIFDNDLLDEIQAKIKKLKHHIYCYIYTRFKTFEDIRNFERKHLL